MNDIHDTKRKVMYDLALEFMNELLFPIKKTKYKSIIDIRYVYAEDIINQKEHNLLVVGRFDEKIRKVFSIRWDPDNGIIAYINRVLKRLEYVLQECRKYKRLTYNVVKLVSDKR